VGSKILTIEIKLPEVLAELEMKFKLNETVSFCNPWLQTLDICMNE